MPDHTTAKPEVDLRALRLETLRAIAALAEEHDLPEPVVVHMTSPLFVELRLDDDKRDGVAAWQAVLKLGAPLDSVVREGEPGQFTSVRAERYDSGWLGWPRIVVLSFCYQIGGVQ